jgi:hypothetical protein
MGATVFDEDCQGPFPSFQSAIALFPRDRFDFVWLVSETEIHPFDASGLLLIASVAYDRLYRIESKQ